MALVAEELKYFSSELRNSKSSSPETLFSSFPMVVGFPCTSFVLRILEYADLCNAEIASNLI